MKDYIRERALEVADYVLKTKATVRAVSNVFGISKSTIHKDLTQRLPIINPKKYKKIREILDAHIAIRHIRGGMATKAKFANKKGRSDGKFRKS